MSQAMGKVMDGDKSFKYQAMENTQKQQDFPKARTQNILREKDQLTVDLNSMEKSFSNLLKRFEKQEELIKGYYMNEESLKQLYHHV